MGAGHSHALETAPRASERTSTVLSVIVGVILFLTTIGAMAVWPSEWNFLRSVPTVYEGAQWVSVEVVDVDSASGVAEVIVDGQEDLGLQTLPPADLGTFTYEVGDGVRALQLETGELIFGDFERTGPMLALLILYVILVVAIAWWRGIGALLGLAAAFGVIVFFTVPALFDGGNALVVGLVTGAGALALLLYLAHGINARTTTAYLGTLAGLSVTAVLAWWAVGASRLTGVWSEEGAHLELSGRSVDLQGLVLCGIVIAGLGVLNDVTVTQSSAVWELRAARPDIDGWNLFRRGMRIGRDHIASTVYTIAFAYVGAALPTIMLISLYDSSVGSTLTSAEIAEEMVRTLVTSIGLVLAVPLTTGIAALVVGRDAIADDAGASSKEHVHLPAPRFAGFYNGSPTLTVLIHGQESSAEEWTEIDGYTHGGRVAAALDAAQRSWLACDLYGHGTWSATEADFDVADINDDIWPEFVTRSCEAIAQAVDDYVARHGAVRLQLVSYSLGAIVLTQLLRERPDLAPTVLVLATPTPERDEDDEYSLHHCVEQLREPSVTLLAGTADDEVPIEDIRWLAPKIAQPCSVVEYDSGHSLPAEWADVAVAALLAE